MTTETKIGYIDKLEKEIIFLKGEISSLRQTLLNNCRNENSSLFNLKLENDLLRKALAKEKHKNAMLILYGN